MYSILETALFKALNDLLEAIGLPIWCTDSQRKSFYSAGYREHQDTGHNALYYGCVLVGAGVST